MHFVRNARSGEAAALTALQFRASAVWDDQRAWLASRPDLVSSTEQELSEQIAQGWVRVAEDGGEVVGFSAIVPLDEDTADLDGLFVDPGRMSTGVGRTLVADAVARLRAEGRSQLTVLANLNALGFYERSGFRPLELVSTQFTDAMRMELR